MTNLINRIFEGGSAPRQLTDITSAEDLELRIERKLIYVLHLLGIYARTKRVRKSLPATHQFTREYKGTIANKTLCSWEQDFIRNAISEVLNSSIHKMRFYIDVDLRKEADPIFPRGEVSMSLNYYIH